VLPQPLRPRLAGNVRAWPAVEANAIIATARGERIPSKPRRPISATNFSLLAWEARTAQQMWGDRESEATYNTPGELRLMRQTTPSWQQVGVCEQTPECRREHLRPPAR
jgi:hypothetical protein